MQDFRGKTAVVTGAASGIGLELARVFAGQGMNIVLADIEQGGLIRAVDQIRDIPSVGGVSGLQTDVTSDDSVAALLAHTVNSFGAVHILCNNAGVYTGGCLWEQTPEDFDWMVGVNQRGVANGIRHFVPQMIRQGDDCHVVNTASVAGLSSLPFAGLYHMTKHAVVALSECLYHELSMNAPRVKVSCLCPEMVNTRIASSQRNRPGDLARENKTETRDMLHSLLEEATARGIEPEAIAERVLEAVRAGQFYILPPADDAWMPAIQSRCRDLLAADNPGLCSPAL